MAVFGLPAVHEDDALRAVRAGLAIRARLRRLGDSLGLPQPLEVRVGIESGEAATGARPGRTAPRDRPGRERGRAAPDRRRPRRGAGRADHARAHRDRRLVRRTARRRRARASTATSPGFPVEGLTTRSARRTIPFVGRSSELTILRECLMRSTGTGQPVLVTILGEPGIGKSRLADELVAGLGDEVIVLAAGPARTPTPPRSRPPRRSSPSSPGSRTATRPRRSGAGSASSSDRTRRRRTPTGSSTGFACCSG